MIAKQYLSYHLHRRALANCFSLSLFFFDFQITKKFIKEYIYIYISQRLEIFNLFHYHLGIIFNALNCGTVSEKFPLVNRIFRALCSNKGSLCFQSLLLQFFDKIQLPSPLLPYFSNGEIPSGRGNQLSSRIIRLERKRRK